MTRYRKKPVVIDAVQWTGDNLAQCRAFLTEGGHGVIEVDHGTIILDTLEGRMNCPVGHWIIRGVKGEHYSCDPDVFAATYEAVDE